MRYLMLIILLSCSSFPVDKSTVYDYNGVEMAYDIIPHVQEFERLCGEEVDVPIYLSNHLSDNVAGACFGFGLPRWARMIVIDKEFWEDWFVSDSVREELIFHELGHCVLDRDHNKDWVYDEEWDLIGRPASIMYPEGLGYYGYYEYLREEYIRELCPEKVDTEE